MQFIRRLEQIRDGFPVESGEYPANVTQPLNAVVEKHEYLSASCMGETKEMTDVKNEEETSDPALPHQIKRARGRPRKSESLQGNNLMNYFPQVLPSTASPAIYPFHL
jgi:hypothetical protein